MERTNSRRCLLAQAAIYVEDGTPPIADEVYLAAPSPDAGPATQLIRALRAGSLIAAGALHDVYRTYASSEKPGDWLLFSIEPLVKSAEIDASLWSSAQVNIQQSRLLVSRDVVERI